MPNAQHLWLYLLTGDATVAIPGVVPIDREGLAAKLDWIRYLGKFDTCVREIERKKMAHFDWEAGLVWCPAAFQYNKPQSPNVVRSWGKVFDLLPECPLKGEVWKAIQQYCNDLDESSEDPSKRSYSKAFDEAFPEDFSEVSMFTVPVTDSEKPSTKKKTRRKKDLKAGDYGSTPDFIRFWDTYPNRKGKMTAHRAWLKALKEKRMPPIDDLLSHVERRSYTDPQWTKDDGQFIPMASTFLNQSRWEDEWRPARRGATDAYVGKSTEARRDGWIYDTYREEDFEKFKEHRSWAGYIEYAVDQGPRRAVPFEEWLKEGS
jgi:hypothetical protein